MPPDPLDPLDPPDPLDRRSMKTRAAIHTAFAALMLDQGYDALSMTIIAAHANVGRSTLYEHYRTKHDLLVASVAAPFGVLAELAAPAGAHPPAREARCARVASLLRHFRAHQQVARTLLGWPTRALLGQALAELIAKRLASMPDARPLIAIDIIARQVADAQLALVECWVLGRPACAEGDAVAALVRGSAALIAALITHA